MRILGIVPARGNSKRLPQKNLRTLDGKPLVEWSLAACTQSKLLDRVVLSSDDSRILKCAKSYPSVVGIQRPDELADDASPAIDYVRHALRYLEQKQETFDLVVIVQPTSPFTTAEDIDNTIQLCLDSAAPCAASVMSVDHAIHPVKLKTLNGCWLEPFLEKEDGRMSPQQLPQVYVRNGSVYVSRIETIHRGQIVCEPCVGYVMPRDRSVDINEPIDLQFAEFLLHRMRRAA